MWQNSEFSSALNSLKKPFFFCLRFVAFVVCIKFSVCEIEASLTHLRSPYARATFGFNIYQQNWWTKHKTAFEFNCFFVFFIDIRLIFIVCECSPYKCIVPIWLLIVTNFSLHSNALCVNILSLYSMCQELVCMRLDNLQSKRTFCIVCLVLTMPMPMPMSTRCSDAWNLNAPKWSHAHSSDEFQNLKCIWCIIVFGNSLWAKRQFKISRKYRKKNNTRHTLIHLFLCFSRVIWIAFLENNESSQRP